MADNLGLNQTRVLDTAGRSFESVTYQRKKPPLSCEANLDGKLAAEHAQSVFTSLSVSGWNDIGAIKDTETGVKTGDIICSSSLPPNTIKLMAPTPLVAWVNGMRVVVTGTDNNLTPDNIITLPAPPTSACRADFVFLEVWRKLITPTDTVYENGNILYGGVNPPNDLIDPTVDIETSYRIQVQYRIRVSECDIQSYPEGFDPSRVFLQGPMPYPSSGSDFFTPMPNDPGCWRAGTGEADNVYGTVDGYTYAIPICVIARRNTHNFVPETFANGAGRTLADYLAGLPSDRPDNRYSDYIVSEDILDLRHVVTAGMDIKALCEKSFRKLLRGELPGKMGRNTQGEDRYGINIVQADGVAPYDQGWFTKIGTGDGIRRTFCNASVRQDRSIFSVTVSQKDVGYVGSPWVSGDRVTLSPIGGTVDNIRNIIVNGSNGPVSVWNDGLGVRMVAVSGDGIYYSDEGLYWTTATTEIYPNSTVIRAGDIFYTATYGSMCGSTDIYSSLDGDEWALIHNVSFSVYDFAWNVNTLVVCGYGEIITTSNNGASWSSALIPNGVVRMIWGNGQYLGVGGYITSDVVTSSDGITWTVNSGASGSYELYDVVWNGLQYIACGFDLVLNQGAILTSTDNGASWNPVASVPYLETSLMAIAINGSVIVAVSYNSGIITSTDGGLNWNLQESGLTALFEVTWDGSKFMAFSAFGDIYTSSNGLLWETSGNVGGAVASVSSNLVSRSTPSISIITSSLQSYPLTVVTDIQYNAGLNGFSQLPTEILEFRKETPGSLSIASTDRDIPVRDILNGPISNASLSNRGGEEFGGCGDYSWVYDFGHQMILHVKGTGTTQVVIDNTIFGYNILGVVSLHDGLGYRSLTDVTRTATQIIINSTPLFPLNSDLVLNLYTESTFFKTTKQGRGIENTYDMRMYSPVESADGIRKVFTVNTGTNAVLRMASNSEASGNGYVYVDEVQTFVLTNNDSFPMDTVSFEFSTPPTAGAVIEVPLLTYYALTPGEGYVCYYKTQPYQGLLTAQTQGIIEAEGPAITTTAGSGGITYPFNQQNIIDRLPTLNASNDHRGHSDGITLCDSLNEPISDEYPVIEVMVRNRVQDILDQPSNNLHIGMNPADRGRSTVHIEGLGNLGLKYEFATATDYRKTYQSYILNNDSSGELYLMVVGGETYTPGLSTFLNENSDSDSVDIFRIPGRPVMIRKVD